jgi:hypothetical protein
LGFRAHGFVFRNQGLGFGVWGQGLGFLPARLLQIYQRVVQCRLRYHRLAPRALRLGCSDEDLEFRIWGSGFKGKGLGFAV